MPREPVTRIPYRRPAPARAEAYPFRPAVFHVRFLPMPVPRFFVSASLTTGAPLALPESAAHHAARVLRLRVGDAVTLFNGEGGEYAAVLAQIDKHRVLVDVGSHNAVERESPLEVTLIQSISSGERMDTTLQKAVELGVRQVIPVMSERSVVRLQGARADKRLAHWQQVVISACEQCGRNRVPEIRQLVPLTAFLSAPRPQALRWVLTPGAESKLRDLSRPEQPIELLIGPEGGFTEVEVEKARAVGFLPLCLGPRVLRTETAAPALLASVLALWGDF